MTAHDPKQQISYIQQCLSGNKRPLGFFVGAGCPLSIRDLEHKPIIPDIAGITDAIKQKANADDKIKQVFGRIMDNFKTDGVESPNIEQILTHIRALRAVAGNEEVRGLTGEQLDLADSKICELIEGIVAQFHTSTNSPYHYFANWIGSIKRDRAIQIFTTNYDLLMEQALESMRIPYFDGFSGSNDAFFDLQAIESDELPTRWARLWKLHGSVNWFRDEQGSVYRTSLEPKNKTDRMIHPSHLKYDQSRRMPFLVMIDRIRAFLNEPTSTLFLTGYSFGDEHLNEVIFQGLQANPTATAFALLFLPMSKYDKASKLAEMRPNLSLLARDEAFIGGVRYKWAAIEDDEKSHEVEQGYLKCVDGPKVKCTEFLLGDYAKFGSLLKVLSGHSDESATIDRE